MALINVLIATTTPDVTAEVIAEAVAARADMHLLERRPVAVPQVEALLSSIPAAPLCALVVVGGAAETNELAKRWLAQRPDVVVMDVDVAGDTVRIAVRAPRLDPLLTALRELVERVATQPVAEEPAQGLAQGVAQGVAEEAADEPEAEDQTPAERPLLDASVDWVHKLLRDAVENVPDENGDVHGLSVTRATLLQALDEPPVRRPSQSLTDLLEADAALDRALAAADPDVEPLAAVQRVFELGPLEFRMLLLALAPELDLRFQRCIGFLLDEMGRRVGTLALYARLLGPPAAVRTVLSASGTLTEWLAFEGSRMPAADEPLRLDPYLAQWLLGDRDALASEPRVRRVLRIAAWPGATLLDAERARAADLLQNASQWLVLAGTDPAGWRALFELGDGLLIRVEPARLANADLVEIEECARRIGRMARLTGGTLVLDCTRDEEEDGLRLFLTTLGRTECHAAVICNDAARIVKLLGDAPYELVLDPPLPAAARVEAVRAAATAADSYLSAESAGAMASRYPLTIDQLEQATRLASSRPKNHDLDDPSLARFTAAAREIASEGVSHLADRIEPIFSLEQVVLPADRKQQLAEVVDHVRLAPRVLDEWKFGEQLPYGRGVTALFHGASGTGKTMAAMGIARRLGIQLLRLDFSKVVSKYIGDTEKNIDRVFTDAQRSGAAILIDEADALLGKRSEVRDAHDRYANIEVAYLLQRMEAYEGLAILTTNLRQNLDPAFLRRLRFVVDFPRPDAEAREQIWRQCLPEGSHELDDAAFRQLGRKVDLTGGHIRQITLRAAFLAAAAETQIGIGHIVQAARSEFAKLGMPPADIDVSQARKVA
ncbi:MAG TPA: ATP-binding protein [Thermoanaerobaculia bacterium]|nr:ATP-binding protein [Thermoanaerobaculia bacterium]